MRRILPGFCLMLLLSLVTAPFLDAAETPIPPRVPDRGSVAIERDLRAGRITKSDAALYRAYELFSPDKLSPRYRRDTSLKSRTCVTPQLTNILHDWDNLPEAGRKVVPSHLHPGASRGKANVRKGSLAPSVAMDVSASAKTDGGDPDDTPSYDRTYATANFLIHYSSSGPNRLIQSADANSNGIPDMVEYAGQYFETTWTWMIDNGYDLPPGTDTDYYNVYFEDLSIYGALGYSAPIDMSRESRSYIVLTTDWSGFTLPNGSPIAPADEMRLTCSHEFFHAVQFGYDSYEDSWWMESCAMWIEDNVGPAWDSVNDYVGWVGLYLYWPEVGLDADYWSSHWYMTCLWPIYLQSHVDADGSIIREIWEGCVGAPNAMDATKSVLAGYLPGGFQEAWLDFLVANYQKDYPEAAAFPSSYGNLYFTDTNYSYPASGPRYDEYSPEGLGSNYVRFYPAGGSAPDLSVSFTAEFSTSTWQGMLVGKKAASYDRQDFASSSAGTLYNFAANYTQAVLIVTPAMDGYIDGELFFYDYTGTLLSSDGTPPSPNPMTWSSQPHQVSTSSIAMTATTATDAGNPPVSYYFDETSGHAGGTDGDWQSSTAYTDSSLSTNTLYSYKVRARDSASNPNSNAWSSSVSVYTAANTPTAPTVFDPSPTKVYLALGEGDSNPLNTTYAVYNQTLSKYVLADGSLSASAFFQTRAAWDVVRVSGLSNSTTYSFAVKAANGDGVQTSLGPSASLATLPADTQPPAVSGLGVVPTYVKESLTASTTLLASASDRPTGGSDIVAAEYHLRTDLGAGNGTPMQPADGAFDSPIETFSAIISTPTWLIAESPYPVYLRARDETGLWSPRVSYDIEVVDGIPPLAVSDLAALAVAPDVTEPVVLTLDSVTSEAPGHAVSAVIDSNVSTWWATLDADSASADEIVFDLDEESVCTSVTLVASDDPLLFPTVFRIKLYDGSDWYTVVSEYVYTAVPGPNTWQFAPRTAVALKICIDETPLDTGSGLYWAEIAEVSLARDKSGKHEADLQWTAPSDVGPTGRAASYQFRLASSPDDAATFTGESTDSVAPIPAAAGLAEDMHLRDLTPGMTYYVVMKSLDQYDNISNVSNIAVLETCVDENPYVALDGPADEIDFQVDTPPTFSWHANILDYFRIQFSNVPDFPARAYRLPDRRVARTYTWSIRRGQTFFTPSRGQWKALKKLAADMDGTLYWRVQARCRANRALGIVYSEVALAYGFDSGVYDDLLIAPYHDVAGDSAVWPNARPIFVWTVSNPIYTRFYLDFSATPEINHLDRRNTVSLLSRNADRTWFRPTTSQWRLIKRKLANVNSGQVYWRVRGFDIDRAYSSVSAPALVLFDTPTINLRKPAPRRDGTVMPGEVFTLDWNIDGEGYNRFKIEISTDPGFPRGRQTFTLANLTDRYSYTLRSSHVRQIAYRLARYETDTFYWRVTATEFERTMSTTSDPQAVVVSVTPAIGGA